MAASVLNTPIAVAASLAVVRAFVKLREFAASHAAFARRLDELERKYATRDRQLRTIFGAIRRLMTPPRERERKGRIGFHAPARER